MLEHSSFQPVAHVYTDYSFWLTVLFQCGSHMAAVYSQPPRFQNPLYCAIISKGLYDIDVFSVVMHFIIYIIQEFCKTICHCLSYHQIIKKIKQDRQ